MWHFHGKIPHGMASPTRTVLETGRERECMTPAQETRNGRKRTPPEEAGGRISWGRVKTTPRFGSHGRPGAHVLLLAPRPRPPVPKVPQTELASADA